jgi:hypothetical protein
MNRAVKHLIWFFIFEFLIIFFVLVITGAASVDGKPLQLIQDIADSIGIDDVWVIGTGFFIIGTFANLALMFINIARGGMQ